MKKMVAQVDSDSKQLKFMSAKTKAMSEFAQALIDEIGEHTRKTSKRIKDKLQNEKNNLRHKRPP